MADARSRRLSRGITIACLLIAGYYWVFGGAYTQPGIERLETDLLERESEIAQREAELSSVRVWADSLQTNDRVIERIARERYGFIRPEEVLIQFVELGNVEER